MPQKHDFGIAPVKIGTGYQFPVRNVGDTTINFLWEIPGTSGERPFQVVPEKGVIAPGGSVTATVSFTPTTASVYVAAAILRHQNCKNEFMLADGDLEDSINPEEGYEAETSSSVLMLSGIGKYPFVKASCSSVDFGEVFIGKQVERKITLKNHSQVPAHYVIERKGNASAVLNEACTFRPSAGVIRPEGVTTIKVTYRASSCGLHTLNEYSLRSVGGSASTISVSGVGYGPDLSVSSKRVNFGEVDISALASSYTDTAAKVRHIEKVVVLTNQTKHDASFQLANIDAHGAFTCTPSSGVLPGSSSVNVKFVFTPLHSMNYYRRIHIWSAGSVQKLWVDLIGSAFTERCRPPTLQHRHVKQLRAREKVGLGRLTPEEMDRLLEKINSGDGVEDAEEQNAREALLLTLDPPDFHPELYETNAHAAAFSLDTTQADFGVVKSRGGETRQVEVFNHTSSKATCVWPHQDSASFTVEPATADVAPFSSSSFNVTAKGSEMSSPILSILECYVYYKTMRSYRLVKDNTVMPPTCLTLSCTCRGEGRLSPVKASLSVSKVEFPSVHVGETAYQTISLVNQGDVPTSFQIFYGGSRHMSHEDGGSEMHDNSVSDISLGDSGGGSNLDMGGGEPVFKVYPETGVVPARQAQVLLLKFFGGRTASSYKSTVEVLLDSTKSAPLYLHGASFTPSLLFRNDSTVYFKPTFTDSTTTRPYVIENPCRIEAAFKWDVPQKYSKIIKITPESGVLKGNEKKQVHISFTPEKVQRYIIGVPVVCASSLSSIANGATAQQITVIGEGTLGCLTLEPYVMQIPTVLAGGDCVRDITIYNSTCCESAYHVGWVASEGCEMNPAEVEISEQHGVLPLRSHKNIRIRFAPSRRGTYRFKIFCKAVNSEAEALHYRHGAAPTDLSSLPTCEVSAEGGYPFLEITDVRCPSISKAHLWSQAQVDVINKTLSLCVESTDVDSRDFEFEKICSKHEAHDIHFGAAAVESLTTKILMTLENVSELPVHFRFMMPNDYFVPIERWFHEEVPSAEALHQEHILDNELFSISPAEATIQPHELLSLRLTYKRSVVGDHTLPVVLKIKSGKRILLMFKGKTLHEEENHLDILNDFHHFSPVCIGDTKPPLQYVELRNNSLHPVVYELDKQPFATLYEKSCDFPVFQCLNSYGEIPPLCSTFLQWYFRPLEAKQYVMDANIIVTNSEKKSYTIELRGSGFHPGRPETMEGLNPEFRHLRVFPTLPRSPLFPVVLSQDVLEFGRISVHSLHRRLLLLKNTHKSDAFSFEWITEGLHGEQLLEMYPSSGLVQAGEYLVCRLTLYSGSLCHIIEQSVQCRLKNQSLSDRREKMREEVKGEQELELEGEDAGEGTIKRGIKKHKRTPVTEPPVRYQTTSQLKQTMEKLMQVESPENLDENSADLMWVTVPDTYLDLRLQARVFDFDTLRDQEPHIWASHFHPTLSVYQQVFLITLTQLLKNTIQTEH